MWPIAQPCKKCLVRLAFWLKWCIAHWSFNWNSALASNWPARPADDAGYFCYLLVAHAPPQKNAVETASLCPGFAFHRTMRAYVKWPGWQGIILWITATHVVYCAVMCLCFIFAFVCQFVSFPFTSLQTWPSGYKTVTGTHTWCIDE